MTELEFIYRKTKIFNKQRRNTMRFTIGDLLLFLLWGALCTIIFNIINPSNYIGELILVFLLGGLGATMGGYFRNRKKKRYFS